MTMKKRHLAVLLTATVPICLLLLCCMTVTAAAEEVRNAPEIINVRDYGATGDSVTDDTSAILAAVAELQDGDTLYFPAGTYLLRQYGIPSMILIQDKKDIRIELDDGATLQMDTVPDGSTGTETRHYIFHLLRCENVILMGGRLLGDLYTYNGMTSVQHGYAIRLADCRTVTVRDVEIAFMRGDGISIFSDTNDENGLRGRCYDITIENCRIHECRRNGITLTSVDGCTIRDTVIHDIFGTMPQAAIDIEAEYLGSKNSHVRIENCHFYRNGSWSLSVAGEAEDLTVVSTRCEDRITVSEKTKGLVFQDCELEKVGIRSEGTVFRGCQLDALILYDGEVTCTDCEFDGKGAIPYRVLVTKSTGTAKATFQNCIFRGRGLSALGGCLVFCHTPPASLTFTDCRFESCGLFPFFGSPINVEREGCSFRPGWALWLCIIACVSLVAFLIIRHKRRRVWVCR